MKGLSPENDEYPDFNEDSLTLFASNEPWRDLLDEQPSETQSASLPANKKETKNDNNQTKKLSKQVSWGDGRDIKNESTDSGDESSQEDGSTEELNTVCDNCSLEMKCCTCDNGMIQNHQCKEMEKNDKAGEKNENEGKEKEKDVEPGKFDGVFSDTDDSDASAER